MMSSPSGATASPEESHDKIEPLRFKSSSDSRRIPRLLEENVVALDKVWVQYNILLPKHSSLFFPDFEIPLQNTYCSLLMMMVCMTLQEKSYSASRESSDISSSDSEQPSSSFTANSACDFQYRNLVSDMQLFRAQLSEMHDLQQLLPVLHQLRAMHQEIAPVLHGVQAWQQNVLHDVQAWQQNVRSMLEHMLKQQEEFNRVVDDIRLKVECSTSSQE
jgi:hypothetical protein